MNHSAKFCQNPSNGCGDMVIFRFSRWRLFAILDYHILEILTAGLLWTSQIHHRARFHQNQSNGSGDMAILDFSRRHLSAILVFKFQEF